MRYFVLLLFLLAPSLLYAKSFSYTPPSSTEIRSAILEVSSSTHVRSALLFGLLGQETAFGKNIGKTDAGWASFCSARRTQDCQSWKTYDCKNEYGNARHFDDILTQLGFLQANGGADRKEIPVSSTCALGLTQFEPNTWWGIFSARGQKIYNPWSTRDAVYAAALYLRDLGADENEVLNKGEVIGAKDKIALQKYYCGAYYRRTECVAYALGVERQARRAETTLLIRDLEQQVKVLKLQKAQLLLGQKSAPSIPRDLPPVMLPSVETPSPSTTPTPQVGNSPQEPMSKLIPEVPPPFIIETTTLPSGVLREPYSTRLTAHGGKPPYRWSAENIETIDQITGEKNGALPKGLFLDGAGSLSGTPESAGTTHFTLAATDARGQRTQTRLEIKTTIPFMRSELRVNSHDGITDYDPTIVKRKNGELVIIFVSYGRNGKTGLFSMRSLDNGKTWTPPEFVYSHVRRSEVIEGTEGDLLVFTVGNAEDAGKFIILRSRDGGNTWDEKYTVDSSLGIRMFADSLIRARDGYYYASYRIGFTDEQHTERVYVTRSKDLLAWETPIELAGDSPRGEEFPSALLEGEGGELYLSYLSGRLNAVAIASSHDGVLWAVQRNISLPLPLHLNPNGLLIGNIPVFLYSQGLASGITFISHRLGAYWSDTLPFFAFSQGYFASDAIQLDDGSLAIVASDFGAERDIVFTKTAPVIPPQ